MVTVKRSSYRNTKTSPTRPIVNSPYYFLLLARFIARAITFSNYTLRHNTNVQRCSCILRHGETECKTSNATPFVRFLFRYNNNSRRSIVFETDAAFSGPFVRPSRDASTLSSQSDAFRCQSAVAGAGITCSFGVRFILFETESRRPVFIAASFGLSAANQLANNAFSLTLCHLIFYGGRPQKFGEFVVVVVVCFCNPYGWHCVLVMINDTICCC